MAEITGASFPESFSGSTWISAVDRTRIGYTDPNAARPFYTFADARVVVYAPWRNPNGIEGYELEGLNFLSWSKHRDKYPVVGHGKSRVRGFVYGPRTVAGSIGFSMMGRSAFANLIVQYNAWRGADTSSVHVDTDDLPPLDIHVSFVTPQGNFASMFLRAVVFLDESLNLSVRDSNLTEVYSWMAATCTNVLDDNVDKVLGAMSAAANEPKVYGPSPNKVQKISQSKTDMGIPGVNGAAGIKGVKGPPS